jgi:hypothetical protein
MKKLKKLIVSLLLLVAAFGFLMLITEMLPVRASAPAWFCDVGKTYYCWTSWPYWECRTEKGGIYCTDPVN